jgi:hypothetical protein
LKTRRPTGRLYESVWKVRIDPRHHWRGSQMACAKAPPVTRVQNRIEKRNHGRAFNV